MTFAKEMEIPLYSLPASECDKRLPNDTPVIRNIYEEEVNPFDLFAKASARSMSNEEASSDKAISPSTSSSVSRPSIGHSSMSRAAPPTVTAPIRQPLLTANTFPSHSYDPWSTVRASRALQADYASTHPAEYAPVDDRARTFRLQAPFIYTTKTSNMPCYQIQQEFNRIRKPSKLNIRRLLPSETRSCSVSAIHAARGPRIRYDEEGTMYSITSFEMHGKADSALCGSIQISSGKTLWGGQWTRIWHYTKPRRESTSDPDSDSGIQPQRRSYTHDDKTLLFAIKKGVWEDVDGTVIAREEKRWGYGDRLLSRRGSLSSGDGKILEMTDMGGNDESKRDLVVACWVMRIWTSEGIRWEGDVKGQ
ncbi:uncharacterized protein K460DRAFT_361165 [Cucurbitaria berberidis CBS 394.84]|uniref:Uncharacterized protein n=1 Tax=Cucurbitaria berberidis CBS 394.84 TaxID=1168544 RepID=A0A9P4GS59_9PLEO|nr:uncharacterized protein K460DRAFT_361165 [Cucurbitaria berberidis CBS 394.84]KAF1850360.1 hypothetical protein K460DRAFT_361165 [Cucurbitaria berberidis CBS 394.84]